MVANRASDDPDRTIGPGSGSNIAPAIFALTFTAIDTILRSLFDLIYHCFLASTHLVLREVEICHDCQGGIHERGVLRE
jgi:hypothetical protein